MANEKKKKKSPYGYNPNRNANKGKEKKRMKPETVDKIKTGFLTLVSNNAVVKAGRNYSWIAPILLTILAVIVALIPNFVLNMTADAGNTFLGANTYGYETGLVAFGDYLENNKNTISLEVKDQKLVAKGINDWIIFSKGTPNNNVITNNSSASSESTSGSAQTTAYEPIVRDGFEVFYHDPALMSDQEFMDYVLKNWFPITETPRDNTIDGNSDGIYRTNFIIFNETNYIVGKFPRNSSSAGTRLMGRYDGVKDGFNFLELFTLKEGSIKGTAKATDDVRQNWLSFIRDSYQSTKVGSAWSMTGIMFGVNFGVILLFGFVIWLMTRGKYNPFRSVKVYEAFRMSGWAALSPAILSMIGFWLSAYASFIFIFLFGMRVMWMSMRALRPYETTPAK